jgi:transposase
MANVLEVSMQQSIITLSENGWSQRRIARELGIDRSTVKRYVQQHRSKPGTESKPAIPTAGSDGSDPPKPAISTTGSSGRVSKCEAHRDFIERRLELGLSAQRIWQDLRDETGFEGSYESVKRFVRKLEANTGLPHRRMETPPGREVQVDFGRGASVVGPDGRRRYPHLFRMVLSNSRKGYSEVVWKQTTENFIRAIENAFRHFGGGTATVVIDNLRAAVTRADWYEPELNPKIRDFCRHYGTVMLPTRPRTPQHKGKVEKSVDYAQENALRGHVFDSLKAQNDHLLKWERTIADTRIHGTTKRQVKAAFEAERPALQPLPSSLFPCFREVERKVHKDGHVEVEKAYYSVPFEHTGRTVWVRWDSRFVRIHDQHLETIAVHPRHEPGQFSTAPGHIPAARMSGMERGAGWMLRRIRLVGPHTDAWARAMLANRGIEGLRPLQGLLAMTGKFRSQQLENACRQALAAQVFRLRDIRKLAARDDSQMEFGFLDRHPLIRSTSEYESLVPFPEPDNDPESTDSDTATARSGQAQNRHNAPRLGGGSRPDGHLYGFKPDLRSPSQCRDTCRKKEDEPSFLPTPSNTETTRETS